MALEAKPPRWDPPPACPPARAPQRAPGPTRRRLMGLAAIRGRGPGPVRPDPERASPAVTARCRRRACCRLGARSRWGSCGSWSATCRGSEVRVIRRCWTRRGSISSMRSSGSRPAVRRLRPGSPARSWTRSCRSLQSGRIGWMRPLTSRGGSGPVTRRCHGRSTRPITSCRSRLAGRRRWPPSGGRARTASTVRTARALTAARTVRAARTVAAGKTVAKAVTVAAARTVTEARAARAAVGVRVGLRRMRWWGGSRDGGRVGPSPGVGWALRWGWRGMSRRIAVPG